LTKEQFRVVEDGKDQPIAFFMPVSGGPAAPDQADARTPARGDEFSNRIQSPTNGGVVAIIFDQLNMPPHNQARARGHLLKYLGRLQPNDRVALYVLTAGGLRVLYDFTTDAEALLKALRGVQSGITQLATVQGQINPVLLEGLSAFAAGNLINMDAAIQGLRTETTVEALEAIAHHLAGVPGRKNIVWISSGFPFMITGATPAGTINQTQSGQTRRATRALNHADAALYPIDARGLLAGQGSAVPTLSGVQRPIEGLRATADWTGGRAFFNTNDIGGAIELAVADSRSTYVLGYYSGNSDWNGHFRSIKVRVERPDSRVRHRAGYYAEPLVARNAAEREKAVLDALSSPLEASAIPVSVRVGEAPGGVLLRLSVDSTALAFEERDNTLTSELDVTITQMLTDRRQLPEMSSTIPIHVPAGMKARLFAEPIQLTRTVALHKNLSQIRIVIRDVRSGAIGSVYLDAERVRRAAGQQQPVR
jgi:VWFA-related protein